MNFVFDASALLAIIFEEDGAEVALSGARSGIVSAVNADEVFHKSVRRNIARTDVETLLSKLGIGIVPFDTVQARQTADLHPLLSKLRISFADRACLALGMVTRHPILTADADWATLDLDVEIRLIR